MRVNLLQWFSPYFFWHFRSRQELQNALLNLQTFSVVCYSSFSRQNQVFYTKKMTAPAEILRAIFCLGHRSQKCQLFQGKKSVINHFFQNLASLIWDQKESKKSSSSNSLFTIHTSGRAYDCRHHRTFLSSKTWIRYLFVHLNLLTWLRSCHDRNGCQTGLAG